MQVLPTEFINEVSNWDTGAIIINEVPNKDAGASNWDTGAIFINEVPNWDTGVALSMRSPNEMQVRQAEKLVLSL